MSTFFHDRSFRTTYAAREADATWLAWARQRLPIAGAKALDIGCGGGIYTKAMLHLGAEHVTGVDFSDTMLEGARSYLAGEPGAQFMQGSADATGLAGGCADIVLERALIHHLADLPAAFREAFRLLKPGGTIAVQDRTPDDCLLPASATHLRGYFFELFPRLAASETGRRPQAGDVTAALQTAGFTDIATETLWETRTIYESAEKLRQDLMARTGRSILHELNDRELAELADYIAERAGEGEPPIVEQDRWTIWTARKPV